MKKLIAVAAVALTLASATFAEGITVGLRGIIGTPVGTSIETDDTDLDLGESIIGGGALFGKFLIPAVKALGIQPEIGITYNKIGVEYDYGVGTSNSTVSYTSLDIPVLVTYDFNINDNFAITPEFGPKVAFPLGKLEYGGDADGDADVDSNVLFSLVFGVAASYKVGPGAIVGDIRYDLGLTKLAQDVDVGDGDIATPRGLLFSVGYGINF